MEDNFIRIYHLLYPLSFLYGIGVRFRNKLFDWRILSSRSYGIPLISVGNITVGGTGKTPHTEYLIRLLQKEFKVAVLSRGYKRKSRGFLLAGIDTPPGIIGDEPYQMKQKFPSVHMAVSEDRRLGIEQLCKEEIAPGTEVILLDDAFQHRYVKPGINILLIDFYRLICNDRLLPAGRLREPESGKSRANIVIITKCPSHAKPADYRAITQQINLSPCQKLYFSTFKYGNLSPVFKEYGNTEKPLNQLAKDEHVLLFTGIASPKQLIQDLEQYAPNLETVTFPDHHNFTKEDVNLLLSRFEKKTGKNKIIITTEKDASRLMQHPALDEKLRKVLYSLPVEIEFLQDQQERFNQNIVSYVRKNKRNSSLSKRKNAHKS